MKTTRFFEEQVMRKRPYLRRQWCESAITNPIEKKFSLMVEFVIGYSLKNCKNTSESSRWKTA